MGAEAAAAAATTTTTTSVAPGFRFHPTDEELAWYYLKRKVCGKSFRLNAISELDIYKSEPWDLPGQSMLESKDLEWYFFSPVDKKYANGSRFNRSTGKGYWKATGNDRTIRHGSRTVGFKKTLVFHSGRAPYGKRTNWVMHEYRLVDEELRKSGVAQDAFVLCKILQKGGLGPPNGERYAPFVEEEWDDDGSVLVPGEDVGDDAVARDDGHVEGKDPEQDPQSINEAPLRQSELQRDAANVSPVCKSERLDDCSLPCIPDPGPTSLIGNKRSRHDEPDPSHSNASETSTTTTQEPCPYTTTMNFSSARLEFPLMESIEPKEHRPVSPSTFDAANLDKFVPPGYLKLINNLQNEIHRLSSERETLKIDLMSAQAVINILQSQIDFLKRENEDLKRIV